jgi:putative NADPH-quinone reductase
MELDSEIEHSQELIKWADHFVFFYPIWFETIPSLLKGWFERVFTPGIAYQMDGYKITKYLKGKTAHLVFTSQGPIFWQKLTGNFELKLVKRILQFCGIKTIRVDRRGQVVGKYVRLEERNKFLELIGNRAMKI